MFTLRRHARTALVGTALAASVAAAAPAPARAATVTGSVGSASVVWIAGAMPRGGMQEMRNINKTFVPELLVVPVGGSVRFPNDDPFFHSIYSIADPDPFDIGFYETGPGKDVTFERAGVLDVHCRVHASMHATISAWNAADGLRSTHVRVGRGGGAIVALPRPL